MSPPQYCRTEGVTDVDGLEYNGTLTKLLAVPKESESRTMMTAGRCTGREHVALLAESKVALEENPSEKTQRIPVDEVNLSTSANIRSCEFGKTSTLVEAISDTLLPFAFDTKVAFEANERCEQIAGPGHTRTKKDSVISASKWQTTDVSDAATV
jgi:hypothetical protein